MPRKLTMSELQQIIYRLKMKSKIRAIHKDLGFHRTIIRSLKKTAEELGWLNPESPLPTEEVLQAIISSNPSSVLRSMKTEMKFNGFATTS